MKFLWTTLYVKDLEESLKFYQDIIGLEIDRRFNAGEEREIVFLGNGETKVELIYDAKNLDIEIGKDISLGFQTANLDEMIQFVKSRNIDIHSGPIQANPGTRFFYILDPNGLKIQFVEQK